MLVWIPGRHAAAWVRYAVGTAGGQARTLGTVDVAQQAHGGWLAIPGTFTAAGSITVRMTFVRPYPGLAAGRTCRDHGCAEMAAGQVMLEF